MPELTFAVIIGNRDFFPDQLVEEARSEVFQVLGEMGIGIVAPSEQDTKLGAVETWADAVQCAKLLRSQRERIHGVLVVLPNFGDEKAVADTLKLAELNVPILVQAYPDDLNRLTPDRRRDAFCGKISVCNNLRQYGIPFSLTSQHTVSPSSPEFRRDLEQFAAVCRVVRGLRRARIGAVGARPNAFNTTRYSEKLLQAAGISVQTVDLSEILGMATALRDEDPVVRQRMEELRQYADCSAVPAESLARMARFAAALASWMEANAVDAVAIQCWSSLQRNFGINPCTVMSLLSDRLLPAACEVDVTGALSMYMLQLASGRPSALVDWNNNYQQDPNKCVLFHCGNWPKALLPDLKVGTAPILGSILGEEKTYGALWGRTPAGPLTFARVSTDDTHGRIRAYVGEGQFTDDPLATFGSRAVAEIPNLPKLMRYICRNGFEHHVAVSPARCAAVLAEALQTYLNWDLYWHEPGPEHEQMGSRV